MRKNLEGSCNRAYTMHGTGAPKATRHSSLVSASGFTGGKDEGQNKTGNGGDVARSSAWFIPFWESANY